MLVHCFADCSVEEVLAAVGLEFEALFPERALADRLPRERRPFNPMDVLRCVVHEADIVAVAADGIAQGVPLSDVDRDRLRTAARRLRAALEVCDG